DRARIPRRGLTVELRPSSTVPFADLVELFNSAYEGYLIPFRLDETIVRFMVDTYDLDVDASRVAFSGGEAVGLGNLGLRGEDAGIGGVGVVASPRRHGVGGGGVRAPPEQGDTTGGRRLWP